MKIVFGELAVYVLCLRRYDMKRGTARRAINPNSAMTTDAASGIGNPVYKMFGSPDGGTGALGEMDDVSLYS